MPVLRVSVLAAVLALVCACTATPETGGEPPSRQEPNGTAAPSEVHTILPPDVFVDLCAAGAGQEAERICRRGTREIAHLAQRPLSLPDDQRPCRVGRGAVVRTDDFRVLALGVNKPVRPGVATEDIEGVSRGRIPATRLSNGWLGFKTLWFAIPKFQGPFLVRAAAVGAGSIRRDKALERDMFAVRAATINGTDGYRQVPGGTYVSTPGCYVWQVDGDQFSYQIVFRVHEATNVRGG